MLEKILSVKIKLKKGLNGVKEALGYLKNNYSVALMVDQRVSEGSKKFHFLKMTLTRQLFQLNFLIVLIVKIVPIYIARKNDDSFEMEILNPIDLPSYEKKKKKFQKKLIKSLRN